MKAVAKTSTIIKAEMAYAHVTGPRKCAAALLGNAGVGKTTAALYLCDSNRGNVLVQATTARSTYRLAMKAVGEAIGVSTFKVSTAEIYSALEQALPLAAERGVCLIIDEAQRLDLNALVEIVDFPERFGLPVILFGNPDLLKRSRAEQSAFAQIESRIAMRVMLTKPLRDDYGLIMGGFDVLDEDARAAGMAYGEATSIRELVNMLTAAKLNAEKGPVRLTHMRMAVRQLTGGTQALALLSPAA